MSLTYALAAAVNGTTGLRAILLYGLVRTKHRRRRSGQHQPGDSHAAQAAAPAARSTPYLCRVPLSSAGLGWG
jgi:hypothetical protein